MTDLSYPARPIIIKLMIPEVQSEFARQKKELELNNGEEMSNELFISYMLDIRKAALAMKQVNIKMDPDIVDEHGMEIIGHDDPEPKGEVS